MRNYRRVFAAAIIAASMVFLILNTKDSLVFAIDALELCTTSLIPSLFPFMFLAMLLNSSLTGYRFRFLHIIRTLCRIPEGSEMLFLLGILGGYPIGAQMISNTYHCGNLKKEDAQRMLGFCNNAGPSFLFGVVGPLFNSAIVPVFLWIIQILSAIITGVLLNGSCSEKITVSNLPRISITEALEKSVKTMGLICGWVLLFRIIVGFIELNLVAFVPEYIAVIVAGMLELTNGCFALYGIENSGMRFVLSSVFLSIGGLCVALQAASAAKSLNMKKYTTGKCIQGFVSFILAFVIQYFIFQPENRFAPLNLSGIIAILFSFIIIIFFYRKKTVAFRNILVYN